MGQFLNHLGHQRCGSAVFFRDFVGAARMVTTMQSQMLDGYQPVISLLGKLEYRTRRFLESPTYATVLVALDTIAPTAGNTQLYFRPLCGVTRNPQALCLQPLTKITRAKICNRPPQPKLSH